MINMPLSPIYEKTIYYSLAMQFYITSEIKTPAMQAIEVIFGKETKFKKLKALKVLWDAFEACKGLPEPTKENTWHPNTHNLIDLRDFLLEHCHLNALRMNFIRRIANFTIILYDFDPPWRFILDSVKDEALKKEWKQRGYEDKWAKTYVWWDS